MPSLRVIYPFELLVELYIAKTRVLDLQNITSSSVYLQLHYQPKFGEILSIDIVLTGHMPGWMDTDTEALMDVQLEKCQAMAGGGIKLPYL